MNFLHHILLSGSLDISAEAVQANSVCVFASSEVQNWHLKLSIPFYLSVL